MKRAQCPPPAGVFTDAQYRDAVIPVPPRPVPDPDTRVSDAAAMDARVQQAKDARAAKKPK